jgi:Family of unknown function (DUF6069)
MTTSTPHRIGPTGAHHAARIRGLGVAGAVLAPAAVWTIAVPLIGIDLRAVIDPGAAAQTIGLSAVVPVALVVSLFGWALLALLERRTPRARTIWAAIAVAVLVVSLAGPLVGGVTAAATLTLIVAHIALAAVLIPALYRSSPTR